MDTPDPIDDVISTLKADKLDTPADFPEQRGKRERHQQARIEMLFGVVAIVISIAAFVAVTLRHPGSYFYVQTGVSFTGILFGIGLILHGIITSLRAG